MSEEAEVDVVEEEDTLTDQLADAWDASEEYDGIEQQGGQVSESGGEPGSSSERNPGEPGDDPDKQHLHEGWVRPGEKDVNEVNQLANQNEKPPVGLSLEAREAWKDVPDSVKADIVKRENDYAAGIEKHRAASHRVQGMDQALAPFQQYMQMNGGAGRSIQSLLQTGSGLQMGSPIQKAQIVAGLIKQFGVDIKSLDSMLVGEAPPPEVQQQNQFEQMMNQRLGPMQQQLNYYHQREQQQNQDAQGQVAQEVQQFGTNNEFYNDVRNDMADWLDMAANRGEQMSMDEAYSRACAGHPQISKIMNGRTSQQSVDDKRYASGSISGAPGGGMSKGAPDSTLAALNDAWDNVGRM